MKIKILKSLEFFWISLYLYYKRTSDIDNNLDEPVFLEWYDYCVDIHEFDYERNVTLAAYSKGYRPYTEEQMEDLKRTKAKIRKLERDLEEKIKDYKSNRWQKDYTEDC